MSMSVRRAGFAYLHGGGTDLVLQGRGSPASSRESGQGEVLRETSVGFFFKENQVLSGLGAAFSALAVVLGTSRVTRPGLSHPQRARGDPSSALVPVYGCGWVSSGEDRGRHSPPPQEKPEQRDQSSG